MNQQIQLFNENKIPIDNSFYQLGYRNNDNQYPLIYDFKEDLGLSSADFYPVMIFLNSKYMTNPKNELIFTSDEYMKFVETNNVKVSKAYKNLENQIMDSTSINKAAFIRNLKMSSDYLDFILLQLSDFKLKKKAAFRSQTRNVKAVNNVSIIMDYLHYSKASTEERNSKISQSDRFARYLMQSDKRKTYYYVKLSPEITTNINSFLYYINRIGFIKTLNSKGSKNQVDLYIRLSAINQQLFLQSRNHQIKIEEIYFDELVDLLGFKKDQKDRFLHRNIERSIKSMIDKLEEFRYLNFIWEKASPQANYKYKPVFYLDLDKLKLTKISEHFELRENYAEQFRRWDNEFINRLMIRFDNPNLYDYNQIYEIFNNSNEWEEILIQSHAQTMRTYLNETDKKLIIHTMKMYHCFIDKASNYYLSQLLNDTIINGPKGDNYKEKLKQLPSCIQLKNGLPI